MALDGAAQRLVTLGHDVVVHGRDQQRAQEAPYTGIVTEGSLKKT